MTATKIAALALISTLLAGTAGTAAEPARDPLFGERLPQAAYAEVYWYYCSPVQPEHAAIEAPAPRGDAAIVYEDTFIFEYGSSCPAFYLHEIAGRTVEPLLESPALVLVNR